MSIPEQEVVCTACLKPFKAVPKINIFGFQKYFCPHCKTYIFYPIARKAIYYIIPVVVAVLFFFSALALTETEWGDRILIWMTEMTFHIDEKKSLILWPLFLWSLVRLGGMYNKKVLSISRKILYATGLLALGAVLTAIMGLLAGVMRIGYVFPPLIGAFMLLALFFFCIWKDGLIRKKTELIRPQ